MSTGKLVLIALGCVILAGLGSYAFLSFMFPSDDGSNVPAEEDIKYRTLPEVVQVSAPIPRAEVQDPVTVTGEARGYWYFEGTFPVLLIDSSGYTVGEGVARAQDDWMTTNFVPFEASVPIFSKPRSKTGMLRLRRDDQSGQRNDYVEVPVTFVKYIEEQ